MVTSQITPMVTWVPWNPVSTKKLAPNRFRCSVSPLCTKWVNSYTCIPTKNMPQRIVAPSQPRASCGCPAALRTAPAR